MDWETQRRLQQELEAFKRDINLVAYAQSRGYELRRHESSRSSKVLYCAATNDKVIVARDSRDNHWTYFSVRSECDNGTIIDFVQHRAPVGSLGAVRVELRRWANTVAPHVAYSDAHRVWPSHPDRVAAAAAFARAHKAESCPYLHERGLRPETLQHPRFAQTWRVDPSHANAIFVHRDDEGISGFEAKNHGFTGFCKGGVKTLWQSASEPGDRRLVICESAIDALSYYQLHPDRNTRYVSVAGGMSPEQKQLLARVCAALPHGSVIVGAFDADDAGDRFYQEIRTSAARATHLHWQRHAPTGERAKDWNDVLRAKEREYIASFARERAPKAEELEMSR